MRLRAQALLLALFTAACDSQYSPGDDLPPTGGNPPPAQQASLLGSKGSQHLWADWCATRPDSALLPEDPRSLVVPGVNEGKAVVFNAFWRDCDNPTPPPANCGEYRAQVVKGELIGLGNGQVGTANMFSASKSESEYSVPASAYNNLWQLWGLPGRPAQFDVLVAERHGSPLAPYRNPYPLPGEDPNATHGGTGQLPLVYTQLRNADGSWTGNIGVKFCAFCHNGQLGTEADGPGLGTQAGGAGAIGDFQVAFRDLAAIARNSSFGSASGIVNIASNRGTGAIDQFQLGFVLFSNGDPSQLPFPEMINSAAIGTIKSPPWWNLSKRTQKFHGAILPTDSSRIDMAAYYPLSDSMSGGAAAQAAIAWVDEVDVPFQTWAESLRSPRFPGPIDTALTERGAILFHSKNLWAEEYDNPVPAPEGGNGSCASCHGVYSPRYANDPAYLDTPLLEGIAARIEPMSVIRTDPAYAEAMQSLKRSDGSVNPAINENLFLYCGLGTVGEDTTPTLLAPPLYGIWAAAPYFHNGSVPNIWGVLKPTDDRPTIWRRVSTPRPAGLNVVMGYDTDLQRAYDFDKLGWKYEVVNCGDPGTTPGVDCNPLDPAGPAPIQDLNSALYQNLWFTWNLPVQALPPFTDQQIENRKIYNTRLYSQGNQGHDFTAVLTDVERLAIIEYLKTL